MFRTMQRLAMSSGDPVWVLWTFPTPFLTSSSWRYLQYSFVSREQLEFSQHNSISFFCRCKPAGQVGLAEGTRG